MMIKPVKKTKALTVLLVAMILLNGCGSRKYIIGGNTVSNNAVSNNTASSGRNKSQIHSGVLLGLVKEPNLENTNKNNTGFENKQTEEYRTLWIYGNGKNINCLQRNDGIIAPYGDKFLKLTSNSVVDSNVSDQAAGSDNFYSKYSSYHNFSVVLSQEVNDTKVVFNKDSLKKNYMSTKYSEMASAFVSRTETILYAGNKYAAVKVSQYATGGGTYKSSYDDVKLYDINSLAKLGDKKTGVSLKNFLGSDADDKIKTLSTKYNRINADDKLIKSKDEINDTNLILCRAEGKWTVQVPLYKAYTHEGNGSNFNIIEDIYDTDIGVPKTLTSYDTLCADWKTIQSKIPNAKDAVSSPDKDMLVVLTANNLQIFENPGKGLGKPVKIIPVDGSEKIVLNQWATGDYVSKWTKLFK